MNAVLVGGAGDGTWIVLPDNKTRYELVVKQPVSAYLNRIPEPIVHEVHAYNLFRLHPVTRAVVFAYEKLTPTDIMEKLLEGYRRPKEMK